MNRIVVICLLFIVSMFIFSMSIVINDQISNNGKTQIIRQVPEQSSEPSQAEKDDSTEIAEMLSDGDTRAASNLQTELVCSETEDGMITARLSWTVAGVQGSQQRVVVSDSKYGFTSGKFIVSGLLSSKQDYLEWTISSGEDTSYWRVLTKHDEGWLASETASFIATSCE